MRRSLAIAACSSLLATPANAQFKPFLWVIDTVAAVVHAAHVPPISNSTVEFTNPCDPCNKETVLVNPGTLPNMPAASTHLFFDFVYNSTYQFPARADGDRGMGIIVTNVDDFGKSTVMIGILPPGSITGAYINYNPVLSVLIKDATLSIQYEFRVPNMLPHDGKWHDVQFSLRPNAFDNNWLPQARLDGLYNFDTQIVTYRNNLRIPTPGPAFPIPLGISPVTGAPFSWTFGNLALSSINGFASVSPPEKPGIFGLNANVARFFFWPNSTVDIAATVANNIFWNPTSSTSIILPSSGTNVLFDNQPAAPIFLNGDATPSGFGFNNGVYSNQNTSFIRPLGPEWDPPTVSTASPYSQDNFRK